jgi:hypothetical protein
MVPDVPDIPLEARVDAACTPNERDHTHLAALDLTEDLDAQLRRLTDGPTDSL